jgi:hypothetical protein
MPPKQDTLRQILSGGMTQSELMNRTEEEQILELIGMGLGNQLGALPFTDSAGLDRLIEEYELTDFDTTEHFIEDFHNIGMLNPFEPVEPDKTYTGTTNLLRTHQAFLDDPKLLNDLNTHVARVDSLVYPKHKESDDEHGIEAGTYGMPYIVQDDGNRYYLPPAIAKKLQEGRVYDFKTLFNVIYDADTLRTKSYDKF